MEEKMSIILAKITAIEEKLDKVIKALQEHDGVDEDFNEPYDEYGTYKKSPCVSHDEASWEEELINKRMDIIGQNGNEGLHYEKEKVVKAAREFGKKKAVEVREQLKGATFNTVSDFQHTPPPPKPKRRYYKPKKKK